MRNWILWSLLVSCASLICSCSSVSDAVDVREFHLKETHRVNRDNPVVRAEQQKRLRGAVSRQEQLDRLGQYYSIVWSQPLGSDEPIRVVFHYQREASGHERLERVQEFAAGSGVSQCEFVFAGEDYRKNGRVLCWKVEVFAGGEVLGEVESYLWVKN